MRLEQAHPRPRSRAESPVVAWTIVSWSGQELLTVLSPHLHVAHAAVAELSSNVPRTSNDYDFHPLRASDLPKDIGWRYERGAATELLPGDRAVVDGVELTVAATRSSHGMTIVLGRDGDQAICRSAAWRDRTPRTEKPRRSPPSLVGCLAFMAAPSSVRSLAPGVVIEMGADYAYAILRAADEAAWDVVEPTICGWVRLARYRVAPGALREARAFAQQRTRAAR